ncbi:hypothetical protein VKT23_018754 [Stygiomarasmius scandens]|uniref:Uncharacterized protein n=1 Tax=Marasmiellus scandens TaxID=2682957 RepID=A0ABR1INF3_9AGAR
MSSFHNMSGGLNPFASACGTHFPRSDDLLGFSCNNTAEFFNDFTQKKRYDFTTPNYPSPPPTQSKHNVPLPSLQLCPCDRFSSTEEEDSDSSMVDESCWFSDPQTPISPPPTLPTPSHALPPSEEFFSSYQPDLRVSTSFDLSDKDERQSSLLSPLSPDWDASDIMDSTTLDESVLLRDLKSEYSGGGGYTVKEPVAEKKDDESCWRKWGLCTPRTSPEHLKACRSSLFPYSPPSALPLYSELPNVDSVPPYPNSPLSPSSSLPPIDEDVLLQSPATPSRRSFRNLPEPQFYSPNHGFLDFDELDSTSDTYMAPPSPSSPSLALPGADMDDDCPIGLSSSFDYLDPSIPSSSSSIASSSYSGPFSSPPSPPSPRPGSSSLLLDDSEDPAPRSPSPDNFDLDSSLLNLSECSDSDIQELFELRRRSLEAERIAKSLERTMLDEGWIYKSNEARKTRKRAKERCKELSAMLKLRLGEKGEGVVMPSIAEDEGVKSLKKRDGVTPTPGKKEKEVSIVRNMKQLVARMVLKRKELDAVRTFTGRTSPSISREGGNGLKARMTMQSPSPLKQTWVCDSDEKTNGRRSRDELEDEDDDDDIEMETGLNLSAFSEPPSTDYGDPPWSMMVHS